MIPQKQEFLHKPEEGVYGDCFRTCIACMLDMPRQMVPHDHEAEAREMSKRDGTSQMKRMNDWLAQRGLVLFNIPYPGDIKLEDVLATMKAMNSGIHYMLAGLSSTGCGHYVICKDDQIVCDPSLTDAGIVGPDDGYWWVTILARLT